MTQFKTSEYAGKFDCHAKTILRAMLKDPAPSDWHDEAFDIAAVAKTFKAPSVAALERVMRGRDTLLDAKAAAKTLGISLRRFHQKQEDGTGPQKAVNHGRIVRYFTSDLTSDI
jgi:hypothetical protein